MHQVARGTSVTSLLALAVFVGCAADEPLPSSDDQPSGPTAFAPAPTESAPRVAVDAKSADNSSPFETEQLTLTTSDPLARAYSTRLQRGRSDSESHMATYREHLAAKRYDDAAGALRDALRDQPDDPELLYLLGATYHAGGNSVRAEPALARAIELDPRHVNARKLLCVIMAADGRCTVAAEQIDKLVAAELADAEAYLLRASARFQCNDLAAAEQDADEALRLDPSMAPALLIRSAVRLRQGHSDAARTDLDAARQAGVPDEQWQRFADELTAALDILSP